MNEPHNCAVVRSAQALPNTYKHVWRTWDLRSRIADMLVCTVCKDAEGWTLTFSSSQVVR